MNMQWYDGFEYAVVSSLWICVEVMGEVLGSTGPIILSMNTLCIRQ